MSGSLTAATVDATGIHAPDYADILAALTDAYRGIFGQDAYLDPDSQDGQFLAIIALALADANNAVIAAYNSFSPSTARGVALAQQVRINGLERAEATRSTADVVIVGQAGVQIDMGAVEDANGHRWALPASVTIPDAGQVTVSAQCTEAGAISAPPDSIVRIATVVRGWQSVTNPDAAVIGQPVETDAALRKRQAASTMLPSRGVMDGLIGAIFALGATRIAAYENATGSTDANGLPAHSIALVVEGAADDTIAATILAKKTPGTATYGTTTVSVSREGIDLTAISFYRPTSVVIAVAVTLKALTGYNDAIGAEVVAEVVAYVSGLAIGEDLYPTRLYLPASLFGGGGSETYKIVSVLAARSPASPATTDITIAFNEAATTDAAHVVLTVT